jgi:hypothetical protein
MPPTFRSTSQEKLFTDVIRQLRDLGYADDLLKTDYEFPDYFSPQTPSRVVAAAAFAQSPLGYDSACVAVLIGNGTAGSDLIREYRALAAPLAFEVRHRDVAIWKVRPDPSPGDLRQTITTGQIEAVFREHGAWWKPESIFPSKNIGAARPHQLDFIDLGLIPALEVHVRAKLDPLLRSVLDAAARDFAIRYGHNPDEDKLYQLLFRAVYGKVMRDRGELRKDLCINIPSANILLQEVGRTYGDDAPILNDPTTQQLVVDKLWEGVSFKNLSVEVLAFVWEDLLITPERRRRLSIHATPPNVARFIVHRLPVDKIPENERRIIEPCCGSGTFLVAAMQRLRELLPPGTPKKQRHAHFVTMLSGYDIEVSGLEVARPSLMLADYPNPNGWMLKKQDVFQTPQQSPEFFESLRHSRVVLCNPPFRSFSAEERLRYPSTHSPYRPVELLTRVLDNLRSDGTLGFVLPASAIVGRSYKSIRRRLADRFSDLEVVLLPEGVFRNAKFPTILLMASMPSAGHQAVHLTFSRVMNGPRFVQSGLVDMSVTAETSVASVENSLALPELQSLWDHLSKHERLGVRALIRRGVEWNDFKKNASRYISPDSKRGYVPGFHTADKMFCYQTPPLVYLWNKEESRRRNAWGLQWHRPKVVCNAIRKSQGPWRLAACPVDANVLCSQNFTVIWPRKPWTARSMAAVLNGPVACAYVTTHEYWKHVRKATYRAIPLPSLDSDQIKRIDELVKRYQHLAASRRDFGSSKEDLFGVGPGDAQLKSILLEIDGEVLSGYGLSDGLRQELLGFFRGASRTVPFAFDTADITSAFDANRQRPADQDSESWELLKRALEDDNLSEGSLFR